MGEFSPDWINFYVGLFVAVIVGISGFFALRRWHAYRKPPALDAHFVINPATDKESTTKSLNVPHYDIIVYFAIGVNDNRNYEQPYVAVKFPSIIRVFHSMDHTIYWHGKQPRLTKPHEAFFTFSDLTLRKGQLSSIVFPLIIRTQVPYGEYPVVVELGAPNINANAVEVKLTLNVVEDNFSQEMARFDFHNFEINKM